MKYNELNNKTAAELADQEKKLREELFHLRIKSSTAQLDKKHHIGAARRDIARIQTKLTALKKGIAQAPVAAKAKTTKAAKTTKTAAKAKA